MTNVFFSLGSNLGDRKNQLESACKEINARIGEITKVSSIYSTPPLGFKADNDFYNICVKCKCQRSPKEILQIMHAIEVEHGRERLGKGYDSRTLDIDLIFYGDKIVQDGNLIIPHPSFKDRQFVLQPLNEIGSEFIDPETQLSVHQLLTVCKDDSMITLINSEQINFE